MIKAEQLDRLERQNSNHSTIIRIPSASRSRTLMKEVTSNKTETEKKKEKKNCQEFNNNKNKCVKKNQIYCERNKKNNKKIKDKDSLVIEKDLQKKLNDFELFLKKKKNNKSDNIKKETQKNFNKIDKFDKKKVKNGLKINCVKVVENLNIEEKIKFDEFTDKSNEASDNLSEFEEREEIFEKKKKFAAYKNLLGSQETLVNFNVTEREDFSLNYFNDEKENLVFIEEDNQVLLDKDEQEFTTFLVNLKKFDSQKSKFMSNNNEKELLGLKAKEDCVYYAELIFQMVNTIKVGDLKCQHDPYLKDFEATVVSVLPNNILVLNDTILFPEGGGQPYDTGSITANDITVKVTKVLRKGFIAHHFLEKELVGIQPGDQVHVKLDWNRRYDHMQQHTGQHLISALVKANFGWDTVSWHLGSDISTLDLNTKSITTEELQIIEDKVNENIQKALLINLHLVNKNENETFRPSGKEVPEELREGTIRMIEIESVDKNVCCGTHLSNTSELKFLKFSLVEKCKGHVRLNFIIGNRILSQLSELLAREKALTNILQTNPSSHAKIATGLISTSKQSLKSIKSYHQEIAYFLSESMYNFIKKEMESKNNNNGDWKILRLPNEDTIKLKNQESKFIIFFNRNDIKSDSFLLNLLQQNLIELFSKNFKEEKKNFKIAIFFCFSSNLNVGSFEKNYKEEGVFSICSNDLSYLEKEAKSLSEIVDGKGALQKKFSKNNKKKILLEEKEDLFFDEKFNFFNGKAKNFSIEKFDLVLNKLENFFLF
ncbi:Alanyl-tRNA editing protein Aarsd1 [Lobulomyces angularis]|nr:Alanyl-tRNA editing protein Aarsd1 [Lobulomyces angularis]